MHAIVSIAVALALSLAPPTDDPRAIAPQASDPELVAPASRPSDVPLARLEAPIEPEGPAAAPKPTTRIDAPTDTGKKKCFRSPGQCRQLGITGIVFSTLGVAAIATGIGLALTPNEAIADQPAYETSYQPPGVVLIGMGVGVALTGVLMIVAGHRARKLGLDGRKKQARRSRR